MVTNSKEILQETVLNVSEYLELLNTALKEFKAKVAGEITQAKFDKKGHVYFTIKDKQGSVLDAAIWNYNYRMCGVKIEEGIEVILSGEPSIYPPSGRFSFIASTISLQGEGALKKAYLALKEKLEKEGAFDIERKRPLPDFPQKIGVITSRGGAVINDLLSNLGRFSFQVKLVDSRVEGIEAISELLEAVRTMKKQDIEVLLIMRGGGSLESLQAFNNEALIELVANFPVPVVAAIGHDKDVPLLAMACDYACSTPTAAANLLNKSWEMASSKVENLAQVIFHNLQNNIIKVGEKIGRNFSQVSYGLSNILKNYQKIEHKMSQYVSEIENEIKGQKEFLDNTNKNLLQVFDWHFKQTIQRIAMSSKTILDNNPEKNLALGYSIARCNGKIVRSVKALQIGEEIDLQLKDGFLKNKIINIR